MENFYIFVLVVSTVFYRVFKWPLRKNVRTNLELFAKDS